MRAGAYLMMLLATGVAATPMAALQADRDSSWVVAWDHPSVTDSSLFLVVMKPGWHVTTPAESGVTLLQPDSTAQGSFLVKSVIFAFNADAQPYGIVVGAKAEEYVSFLLGNDGTFGLFHHAGLERHALVPWTAHEAVSVKRDEDGGNAKNVVTVMAGADMVRFFVNGVEVTRRPRQAINMDGGLGLRVDRGTNLHISELTVAALGDER